MNAVCVWIHGGCRKLIWLNISAMIVRTLKLFVTFSVFTTTTYGQSIDIENFFPTWIRRSGIEFSMPEGYKKSDVDDRKKYYPTKGIHLPSSYLYTIINKENDIIIGMYGLPISKTEYTEQERHVLTVMAKYYNPDIVITEEYFNPNNAWKGAMNGLVDSTATPFLFPVTDDQMKELNADTVIIFQMKIDEDRTFQGKYNRCKYVLMQKDSTGLGTILYFYHDENAHLVDAEIARTWGILRYNNKEDIDW